MFTVTFVAVLAAAAALFVLLCRKSPGRRVALGNTMKILAVIYCCVMFVNIFLPDGFTVSRSEEDALAAGLKGHALLRWASSLAFVVLPLAAFSKKAVFQRLGMCFCLPVAVLCAFSLSDFMPHFLSEGGRGFARIPGVSEGFVTFLRDETFRTVWAGIMWSLAAVIPVGIAAADDYSAFRRCAKCAWREIVTYFAVLLGLAILLVPIYVPQYLFGYTDMIFEGFDLVQLGWLLAIAVIIATLYLIFRRRSEEDRYLLCIVTALGVLMQYSSFFGAIGTISYLRLPVQLCNIGAYLILIALLTRSRALFDFTYIVNVVGAIIALAVPDVDGEGIFYLWNMHFFAEHTWVIVTPVLALALGVFPRLDRASLKHIVIGFTAYYLFVLIVGTVLNGLAVRTGNSVYEVNYLFMFDAEKADGLLGVGNLFEIGRIDFYGMSLYPLVQSLVYVILLAMFVLFYLGVRLFYRISDAKKNSTPALRKAA